MKAWKSVSILAGVALSLSGCIGGGGGGNGSTQRCTTNADCSGTQQYCDLPAQKSAKGAAQAPPGGVFKQSPEECVAECDANAIDDEDFLACAFECFPDCGSACSFFCEGDGQCVSECVPACEAQTGGGAGGNPGGAGGTPGGAGGEPGFGGEPGAGGEPSFGGQPGAGGVPSGAGGNPGGAGGAPGGAGGAPGGAGGNNVGAGGNNGGGAVPPGICRPIPRNDAGPSGAGGNPGGFGGNPGGAGGNPGGAGGNPGGQGGNPGGAGGEPGGQGGNPGGQGGSPGPQCEGNFSLGSTPIVGDDIIAPCNGVPPSNCRAGFWITFPDTNECLCLVECSDLQSMPGLGDPCNEDGSITCQHIVSDNGNNSARACVPNSWNLCTMGGGGGGAGGAPGGQGGSPGGQGGSGGQGGGGGACAETGSDCSFDDDCCSGSCSLFECE